MTGKKNLNGKSKNNKKAQAPENEDETPKSNEPNDIESGYTDGNPKQDEEFAIDTAHKLIDWQMLYRKDATERNFGEPSDPSLKEPLSQEERSRFIKLESIVKDGEKCFLRGGVALYEIWKKKLYRESSYFFQDYLKENFEFSRVRAYQIMVAAAAYVCLMKHFPTEQLPVRIAPLLALKDVAVSDYPDVYQKAMDAGTSAENASEFKIPTTVAIKNAIRELGLGEKPEENPDDDNQQESNEKRSLDFKQFKESIEQVKKDINSMGLTVARQLIPGPFWKLNIDDLEEAKETLESITKDIEAKIESFRKLANKYETGDEEFSQYISKSRAQKMGVWGHPDFIFEHSPEPLASKNTYKVTRIKHQHHLFQEEHGQQITVDSQC